MRRGGRERAHGESSRPKITLFFLSMSIVLGLTEAIITMTLSNETGGCIITRRDISSAIIPPLLKQIEGRLRWHRSFDGIYLRIAKRLGVDPSYVSRVANGQRDSEICRHWKLR